MHLKNKDIICEKQSGFSPGHSTGTALLYRKNLPIMNTLCDWLSETMMISAGDSFFRTVISIVFIVLYCPDHLTREVATLCVLRQRPSLASPGLINWKNEHRMCEFPKGGGGGGGWKFFIYGASEILWGLAKTFLSLRSLKR